MLLRDALEQKLCDPSEGVVVLRSGPDSRTDPRSVAHDALARLAELPFSPDSVRQLPRHDAKELIRYIVTSLLIRGPDDEQIVMDLEALLLPADAIIFSTLGVAGRTERGIALRGRPLLGSSIEAGLVSVRPNGFNLVWIGDED